MNWFSNIMAQQKTRRISVTSPITRFLPPLVLHCQWWMHCSCEGKFNRDTCTALLGMEDNQQPIIPSLCSLGWTWTPSALPSSRFDSCCEDGLNAAAAANAPLVPHRALPRQVSIHQRSFRGSSVSLLSQKLRVWPNTLKLVKYQSYFVLNFFRDKKRHKYLYSVLKLELKDAGRVAKPARMFWILLASFLPKFRVMMSSVEWVRGGIDYHRYSVNPSHANDKRVRISNPAPEQPHPRIGNNCTIHLGIRMVNILQAFGQEQTRSAMSYLQLNFFFSQ